jgi:hypothetical protein
MRRMGWHDIGAAEAAKVVAVTTDNLSAILAARKIEEAARMKGQRP